jgi:hypothetical protein
MQGGAPHTLAVPPPPHVWPAGQPPANEPQIKAKPQPLSITPQFLPAGQTVVAVHVVAQVPSAQTMLAAHAPQMTALPQPSGTPPQLRVPHAAAAVIAVQPHVLAMPPPPHVVGAAQRPALHRPPHPSGSPHARFVQVGVQPASGCGGVTTTSGRGDEASGVPVLG